MFSYFEDRKLFNFMFYVSNSVQKRKSILHFVFQFNKKSRNDTLGKRLISSTTVMLFCLSYLFGGISRTSTTFFFVFLMPLDNNV